MPGDDSSKLAPITDLHVYAGLRDAERAALAEAAEAGAPVPRMIGASLADDHPWGLRYETDGEVHEISDGAATLLAFRLLQLVRTRTQLRRACGCGNCLAGLTR